MREEERSSIHLMALTSYIGTDWFGAQTEAGSRKSGPSDTANLSFSTHAAKGSFLSLFCIRGCNPRPPYSRYQTQAGAWSMHTDNLAEHPRTTKHANKKLGQEIMKDRTCIGED